MRVPALPLRDLVLFPGGLSALFVGRPASRQALRAALDGDKSMVAVTQRHPKEELPGGDGFFSTGSHIQVTQVLPGPDESKKVVVWVEARVRLLTLDPPVANTGGAYRAEVAAIPDHPALPAGKAAELRRLAIERWGADLDTEEQEQLASLDGDALIHWFGSRLVSASIADRIDLLGREDLARRLELLGGLLAGT